MTQQAEFLKRYCELEHGLLQLLTEDAALEVIGVIGLQSSGESSILNSGADRTVFPVRKLDDAKQVCRRTAGVNAFMTSNRTTLIDTRILLALSIMRGVIQSENRAASGVIDYHQCFKSQICKNTPDDNPIRECAHSFETSNVVFCDGGVLGQFFRSVRSRFLKLKLLLGLRKIIQRSQAENHEEMSSNDKQERDFPSAFSPESRKFIFQLDLDQDAVREMLGSLPYAHLRAVLLPLELHGKASYFEEMAEIERRSSCPHYGRYLYDLTSSNKCNIEISACVRLENPEEFYEANGLSLTRGEAQNLDRALELETTLSEATVKCDISLNSVQAMNDFYSDYKSGLFDNSFRQAILGSPVEQQNLEPGQPRYSVKVGLNDRIFEAEKDRLQAMENAAKLVKRSSRHKQRQTRSSKGPPIDD